MSRQNANFNNHKVLFHIINMFNICDNQSKINKNQWMRFFYFIFKKNSQRIYRYSSQWIVGSKRIYLKAFKYRNACDSCDYFFHLRRFHQRRFTLKSIEPLFFFQFSWDIPGDIFNAHVYLQCYPHLIQTKKFLFVYFNFYCTSLIDWIALFLLICFEQKCYKLEQGDNWIPGILHNVIILATLNFFLFIGFESIEKNSGLNIIGFISQKK